jgi:hypothetical protein
MPLVRVGARVTIIINRRVWMSCILGEGAATPLRCCSGLCSSVRMVASFFECSDLCEALLSPHHIPFNLQCGHQRDERGCGGWHPVLTLAQPAIAWCGVVWCGVVWCGVVWCGVVWCGVVWCGDGVVVGGWLASR